MIINIGTINPTKVDSVKEAFSLYDKFNEAKFIPLKVSSNISDQPVTLEETIKGAKNRAVNAFKNCEYSVGLESGLFKVSETNTGYIDICVAVIYDGKNYFIGLGPGLEFPKLVIKDILEKGMNATDSFYKNNFTNKTNIGYEEGIVSIMTCGAIDRKEYHRLSVIMALAQLLNKDKYI
jgi:inosine/xanthosine triphosphatase